MGSPRVENASNFRDLFQRSADRAERSAQRRAETVDGRDDGDGNAGRDQTVFDRGGTGFVLQEAGNKLFHCDPAQIFDLRGTLVPAPVVMRTKI